MSWNWINRRGMLKRAMALATAVTAPSAPGASARTQSAPQAEPLFAHGVASGDPGPTRVIIWTRVSPSGAGSLPVTWVVAADPGFQTIVRRGRAEARASSDFTVKVDVTDLRPGTTYYYRFMAATHVSPSGRTKTLPDHAEEPDQLRLAVVSCSHYSFGYFNVYREISGISDLDAVVHLGDYIYEYGPDGYGGDTGRALGRSHEPPHEISTLSDYRRRYAQYRSDPDLQAAHAAVPFISSWDDHETANNSWRGGAANHQPGMEGPWEDRRTAALRAYFEWMPVREPQHQSEPFRFYRTFRWGRLATLHMLETRLTARDEAPDWADMPNRETVYDLSDAENPVPIPPGAAEYLPTDGSVRTLPTPFDSRTDPPSPVLDYALASAWARDGLPDGYTYQPDTERFRKTIIEAPDRQMLGSQQEAWLASELRASVTDDVAWQILGNQVIMARMDAPDYTKAFPPDILEAASSYTRTWIERTALGLPINLDAWDGYPAARSRLYAAARDAEANLVVLTGDTHHFWANNLSDEPAGTPVGVEFATSSITSKGGYDYIGSDPRVFDIAEAQMTANVEDVVYCETRHRGWIELSVAADRVLAEYMTVSDVHSRTYDVQVAKRLTTEHGTRRLRQS